MLLKNEICLFGKVYSSFLLMLAMFKFYSLHIVRFLGLVESLLEVAEEPAFLVAAVVLLLSVYAEDTDREDNSFVETLFHIGMAYALASYTVSAQYRYMAMTKSIIGLTVLSLMWFAFLFIIIGLFTESGVRLKTIVTILLASISFYVSMLNLAIHFPVTENINQQLISTLGFLVSYGTVRLSSRFSNICCLVEA